jgi:tetratricopeptide (TPR) repeat protein
MTMSDHSRRTLWVIATLLVAGALLYGNTLDVPWYFDDFHNIVKNPEIASLGDAFAGTFSPRGISFLSFALNFALGGTGVIGFHLVNILIHIGNAILVYLLLRQVYAESYRWPLAGSLLFLVHPIQTQAVTYIVQRMTSLSCLFLLAAVLLFIRARKEIEQDASFASRQHLVFYGLALLCGILAAFTKENTVVLPLLLLVVDRFLPWERPGTARRRFAYIAPFVLIPILAGLAQIMGDQSTLQAVTNSNVEFFVLPEGAKYSTPTLSPENLRWRYLATEFIVLFIYFKLLIAPFGQLLDYCYPLVERVFNLRSMLALTGLVGIGTVAFYCRKRCKWVLFGLLWFFITLSVESTFFPLDPIYEHRLYLPMVGIAMIFIEFLRQLPARVAPLLLVVVLLACSLLTVNRNARWGRPIEFWKDNVARVGHSYRPKDNLAVEYFKAKRYDEAQALWQEAIGIHPQGYTMHENLGELYSERGLFEAARNAFETAILYNPKPATLYSKLGALHATNDNIAGSIRYLERAMELEPEDAVLVMNLGAGYYKLGRLPEAEGLFRRALALEPRYFKARFSLAFLLYEMGRLDEAFHELERAKALSARDAAVLHYYALVAHQTGRQDRAREAIDVLEKIDQRSYRQLLTKLQAPPKPTAGQPHL